MADVWITWQSYWIAKFNHQPIFIKCCNITPHCSFIWNYTSELCRVSQCTTVVILTSLVFNNAQWGKWDNYMSLASSSQIYNTNQIIHKIQNLVFSLNTFWVEMNVNDDLLTVFKNHYFLSKQTRLTTQPSFQALLDTARGWLSVSTQH